MADSKTTTPTTLQEALVVALREMPNPVKNADNPAFKRDGKALRYADLEATLDACKPILAANGIALVQMPVSDDSGVGVHTLLIGHGEEMDCGTFTLPLSKRDPQGAGGAITYARRYALTALFGLAQEDDDANAACQPTRDAAAQQEGHDEVQRVRQQVDGKTITAKQAGYLVKQAESFGYSRADVSKTAVAHYGLMPNDKGSVDLTGLTNTQMNELLAKMKAHPKNGKSVPVTDEVPVESLGGGEMPEVGDEEIPFFARFHRYEGGGWWA